MAPLNSQLKKGKKFKQKVDCGRKVDVSLRFLEAFMHELISLAYEPCASQGDIVSNPGKGK